MLLTNTLYEYKNNYKPYFANMKEPEKSAKVQLSQLIKKLNKNSNFLSSDEYISVLTETKSICTNKQFTEGLIQSINVLRQTEIHRKNSLTTREQQVLLLIGEGSKSSAIATQLALSKSTIETHRKNIRKKLKLNGKDNLIALALLFSVQHKNATNADNF